MPLWCHVLRGVGQKQDWRRGKVACLSFCATSLLLLRYFCTTSVLLLFSVCSTSVLHLSDYCDDVSSFTMLRSTPTTTLQRTSGLRRLSYFCAPCLASVLLARRLREKDIWLGCFEAASSPDLLQAAEITYLVNCTSNKRSPDNIRSTQLVVNHSLNTGTSDYGQRLAW